MTIVRKNLRVLRITIIALLCSVTLCACNGKNSVDDVANDQVNDKISENVKENGNDIVNTCWHFNYGQTNGHQYTAKFLDDGTILAFDINGGIHKGIYGYSKDNNRLIVSFNEESSGQSEDISYTYSNVEFKRDGNDFVSTRQYEVMVGKMNYVLSPIDEPTYDDYYDTYYTAESLQTDTPGEFAKFIMSGCWYWYGPQSADCEEYIFQDNGFVWIRYRDFVSGDGDYKNYLDETRHFTIDETKNCVKIEYEESCTWHYDDEKDVMCCETYDGPADAYVTMYLVHYSETPSIDMINRDRDIYGKY